MMINNKIYHSVYNQIVMIWFNNLIVYSQIVKMMEMRIQVQQMDIRILFKYKFKPRLKIKREILKVSKNKENNKINKDNFIRKDYSHYLSD